MWSMWEWCQWLRDMLVVSICYSLPHLRTGSVVMVSLEACESWECYKWFGEMAVVSIGYSLPHLCTRSVVMISLEACESWECYKWLGEMALVSIGYSLPHLCTGSVVMISLEACESWECYKWLGKMAVVSLGYSLPLLRTGSVVMITRSMWELRMLQMTSGNGVGFQECHWYRPEIRIAKTKQPIIVSVKGGVSYHVSQIGKLLQPEVTREAKCPYSGTVFCFLAVCHSSKQ